MHARSCKEVVAALALVTAVALDAEAEPLAVPPLAPPPRAEDPDAAAAADDPTAAPAQPDAPPAQTPAEPRSEWTAASAGDSEGWLPVADDKAVDPVTSVFGPRTPRGWWGAGMHVGGVTGVLQTGAIAARLFVDARLDKTGPFTPSARLSAVRAEFGDTQWTAGRADLCAVSFPVSEAGAFWPCGTFEAGVLGTSGSPKPWFSAGAVGRLQWVLADILLAELEGGAGLPFAHEPGSIAFAFAYASAGLGARFP